MLSVFSSADEIMDACLYQHCVSLASQLASSDVQKQKHKMAITHLLAGLYVACFTPPWHSLHFMCNPSVSRADPTPSMCSITRYLQHMEYGTSTRHPFIECFERKTVRKLDVCVVHS